MSDSNKAVFLSYASQDAEAARRICEALRHAGVEVWFDAEGGLEHGDEWDAKIRRQIKECVLFIPVISANTEAREEGYFRIEWDLAAERARGIASGVAFLLPVVIDGTREQTALVPDRFRAVQWTRLPGGAIPPEILQRFLKLWSHRTGALKHAESPKELERQRSGEGPRPTGRSWGFSVGLVVAVVGLGAGVTWWFRRDRADPNRPSANPAAAVPATIRTEFPLDRELAKAVALVETINSTVEDHRLAEDLARAVFDRRPTDAEAVIVNAYVHNRFILRGFDQSADRYATARRLSERALALAPDHPEALFVMGMHLVFRQADSVRAAELLRRAIELQPNRARYYNSYIDALQTVDPPESVRQAEAAVGRFPADAIVRYRLALVHAATTGRIEDHERAIDETLAIAPVATAVIRKAVLQLLVHRDAEAARRTLDTVPGEFRLNDRTVFTRYMVANADGDVAEAIRALATLPGDFVIDFGRTPKRLLAGDLWRRRGNGELARREYEAAWNDLAQEKARIPNLRFDLAETWLLFRLGRRDEARARAGVILAAVERPHRLRGATSHGYGAISLLLQLDERAKALELLREAVATDWTRRMLAGNFATNPDLAPWREDAEIQALLSGPAPAAVAPAPSLVAPPPDEKSVAVLPFANLSGDPAQEYFSDGITEEILGALARERDLRVPGRSSSFSFKGRNVSAAEIAKALNVSRLVEGSVRKSGNKVRISVSLTRAPDGFSEELGTFTEELSDIFALQEKVSRVVVEKLTQRAGTKAVTALTRSPEAYDAFLRGRALQTRAAHLRLEAAEHYERAVELDSAFALAWARLAEARFRDYSGLFNRSPELVTNSRHAIDRALAAQADLPEGLIMRANWAREVAFDFAAAQRDLDRAEALHPPTAELRQAQAYLARDQGNWTEALRRAREALELDPQNGDYTNSFALSIYVPRGEWMEADRLYARAMEIQGTGSPIPLRNRLRLRSAWRGPEAALRLIERAPTEQTRRDVLRADALASQGRANEARVAVDRVEQQAAAGERPALELLSMGSTAAESLPMLEACGHQDLARQVAEELRKEVLGQLERGNRGSWVRRNLIQAEMTLGHPAVALAALEEWRSECQGIPSVFRRLHEFHRMAIPLYAALGQADVVVALLRECSANGYHVDFTFEGALFFGPVRDDPRFQEWTRQHQEWKKRLPDPIDL